MSTEAIDSVGDVGQSTCIAVDSNDRIHISYRDNTNGDLKYATNASGSWVTSTIDSVGDLGGSTSIAIDSNDEIHISYYDASSYDLKYATNASGSWVTSTIDSGGNVGWHTSIAVDSDDKIHISYQDGTNGTLKYATDASGSWVTSAIDSIGYVGLSTSIAVDSNDRIHICYCDDTSEDLKYATNASGSWITSSIDSSGDFDGFTSIAVDSNDKIHISYCNESVTYDLKYATDVSGSWVTSTIDSGDDDVGWYTSIAVDSNDNVHISYRDNANGDLMYATNSRGSWAIRIVDDEGDVGGYSSLAVNSTDVVHISYYDWTNHDLKYATIVPDLPCVIHGWVNNSETMQGIEGAVVQAFLTDFEYPVLPEMFNTTTNATGFYELSLPGGSTALFCLAYGYYPYIAEHNTTGLTEYRLDIVLEPEPTVPTAFMNLDPSSNVSTSNPLTIEVESEDFNIAMVFVYIGMIQEISEHYVNYTPLIGAAAVPEWDSSIGDFNYTYSEDFFQGTYTWDATTEAGGYLTNATASEYIVIFHFRSINGVESYGVAGYYSNATLEDEVGRAWFDALTGEYLGFEFGDILFHEPSSLPPATVDDYSGVLVPYSITYSANLDWLGGGGPPSEDFFAYEEQVYDARSVIGLTLETCDIALSGDYVSLMLVADDAGNLNGSVETFTVDTDAPSADCGSDLTVSCGDEAVLDGSASSDNVGIVSYEWDFVDGGPVTATGIEAAHIFDSPGEYIVTLTVTDGGGNGDTDIMTVTVVDDENPVADAGADQAVEVGDTVMFDGSGSNDNVGIVSYEWTFEYDGATETLTGEGPTFTFDIAGEYEVTLMVEDAEGNSATDTVTITVAAANEPPVADAGADQAVDFGDTVEFDGGDSTGDIVSYTWTFEYDGDMETLTGESPTFAFDIAGEYEVALTVEDSEGATDTDTVTITVEEDEDEKSFIEQYGLALGVIAALIVVGIALFFLMKKRKGGEAPTSIEEAPGDGPEVRN